MVMRHVFVFVPFVTLKQVVFAAGYFTKLFLDLRQLKESQSGNRLEIERVLEKEMVCSSVRMQSSAQVLGS